MDRAPDIESRRFGWGLAMVLASGLPMVIAAFSAFNEFRGISEQKATGIGAVAGGVAEVYVFFGLAAAAAFSLTGIVLLLRSFSKGHGFRSAVSLISICMSLLVLLFVGWSAGGFSFSCNTSDIPDLVVAQGLVSRREN